MAVSSHAKRQQPLTGRALWLSFAAATTGTFMVNVDSSVVNVALPVMQHQFVLPIGTLQWVVTAYLLTITGVLPVMGQIADRLGRREVFIVGTATFIAGSLLCALSPNFQWLVTARVFQGLGGAIIMANVMAIIALIFAPDQRGKALGLIGSVVAAGTLAGPPLGGVLTAAFGWQSIFWINIPFGLWGLWGSYRYLPRFPRDESLRRQKFDWPGALAFAFTTSLLQFGLANLHNWYGLLFMVLAAIALGLFIMVESHGDHPLVPLGLFKVKPFSMNMIAGIFYWILMMFPAFLLPFFLRDELHLSVGVIGVSLFPQALTMIIVSPWGGTLADKYGVLLPARLGLAIFAVVNLGLALIPGHAPLWWVWALLAGQGIAAGLFSSPNSAAILNSVQKRDTGLASSLMATERNLGRAIGVGLATETLSLIWVLIGIGPSPSHTNPHYSTWFLLGFHGVFWVAIIFSFLAFVTTVNPDTSPHPRMPGRGGSR
ncbi:MFS transporter [Sulfobacillus sp. hq2]|uniref:MFS transporter n=1 Tax=Sulfobacillus TaxID=28033 RepID=UPI000CD1B45E|nr:MFS transporter [Sulfobacillus sp. hq2]POB11608.1 MFS transporter [Sulfobacillus sp. hq2]